jgi:type VI secretion system protein ImpE
MNRDVKHRLKEAKLEIKKNPSDIKQRLLYFQLLSVSGKWKEVLAQLEIISELGSGEIAQTAMVYKPLPECEINRESVFHGEKDPLILGKPEKWLGMLVKANQLSSKSEHKAAATLRRKAYDESPAYAGIINGEEFSWIADMDSRLGPVLEVIINGKYYWTSFANIKSIKISPPADIRDLVWCPASFIWINGGKAVGFIPSRYVDSSNTDDDDLKFAKKTIWNEEYKDFYCGLGQRMFTTNKSEYSLLDVRNVEFRRP